MSNIIGNYIIADWEGGMVADLNLPFYSRRIIDISSNPLDYGKGKILVGTYYNLSSYMTEILIAQFGNIGLRKIYDQFYGKDSSWKRFSSCEEAMQKIDIFIDKIQKLKLFL